MAQFEGLQPGSYAAVWLSFGIGSVTSLLRFYCRSFVMRNWGWDDSCAVLIFLVTLGQQYVLQSWLDLGCGRQWDETCTYYSDYFFKVLFMEQVLIYFMHFLIKTGFCLFYLRLSPDPAFRKFVFAGMAYNTAVLTTIIFIVFFQCTPFIRIVEPLTHATEGSCIATLIPNVVPPILTITVDLFILVLPIRTIINLQMSGRRKLGILSVVCFGLASLALSAVRLPFVLQMTAALAVASKTYDMSYNVAKMIILVALEIQFANIALNLPALASLWHHYKKQLMGTVMGGEHDSGNKYVSWEGRKRTRSSRQKDIGMGTITRLERGMTSRDSETELVQTHNSSTEAHGTFNGVT